jgi:hypothetical protein
VRRIRSTFDLNPDDPTWSRWPNGWGAAEPAWWLNLQADPQAVVELAGGIRREVLGRPAVAGERERLWQRWRELDKNLDSYAARRPHETAVVVLEPRAAAE